MDRTIYRLSRSATRQITTIYELRLIADASHLFEEPGKLDEVAQAAAAWFLQHLAAPETEIPLTQP
ncbi:hypothetical protein VCB98_08970 [Gammaproteobacteria bacterium AB-CW1]|uniref:Alpha/beta hydrolase n=1 Tax=Natronospira elongata TaxID=3110268 RepID=A0AAP6MK80_9GAMM|nr:hypothetical protein [Gammaproteobacteria bacterium AB-CW1]